MEFILTLAEQFWQWTVVIILIIIGLTINIIDRKQINKWRVNFKYDEYPHMTVSYTHLTLPTRLPV